MKPQNFEERIIWYSLMGTYILYVLGLIYLVNSTIAWILLFYLCKKLWNQTEDTPLENRIDIPWVIWIWIISMLVMAIATVIGLMDFDYDQKAIIRGLLNWTRDWALLALFPLAGSCLDIRPQLIYRAICVICLQSLCIIPVCYLASALHVPPLLYSSPLERITQNGPIYYNVLLYIIDYDSGSVRLSLFTPWAPALGLLSCIYFFFALQERKKKWRWIGIVGSIVMGIVSASRSTIIFLPIVSILIWFLTNFYRPSVYIGAGITSFMAGIFSPVILESGRDFKDAFTGARASSSLVRERLERIALERSKEAPIWGHGNLEPGSKVVEHMPIGSHHTWKGLLFVKGSVGFFAFLVPVLFSLIDLAIKSQKDATARVALSFFLTLLFFTSTDTQEILAYLYWPGLVLMGIAFSGNRKNTTCLSDSPIVISS
ncbi:MAG TPA: O-antigen ligase domain-containing protein [Allocoleopsis sp.]